MVAGFEVFGVTKLSSGVVVAHEERLSGLVDNGFSKALLQLLVFIN